MAQIKISQLSATTQANDNVWLVVNDSGETTTNKIKRSDLLSGTSTPSLFISGDGNRSVISNYYNTTDAPNDYDMLIGGSGNTITAVRDGNYIFGGFDNAITTPNGGYGSSIISSYSSTLTNGGFGSIIAGGYNNTLANTNNWAGGILGGENNNLNGARSGVILGGNNNNLTATYGVIAGGQNNTLSGSHTFVVGYNNNVGGSITAALGDGHSINNGYSSQVLGFRNKYYGGNDNGGFLAGSNNIISMNGGVGSFNIGGSSNRLQNFRGTGDAGRYIYGGILGGYDNYIGANRSNPDTSNQGQNAYPLILGGTNNTIIGVADGAGDPNYYPTIINGEGSTISGATTGGTIINSTNSIISRGERINIIGSENCNTIASAQTSSIISSVDTDITGNTHERVVMLGTSGRTDLYSETTHTEHLLTYGQISNGYYDNLSGDTFTIDWNNGNSQKVYMTGATSLDFTNVRDGAQYRLQVVNGGSHTITGATASGYSVLCEGGNIPNITNNGVDLCVLEVMDTDILVRHFANFSAP